MMNPMLTDSSGTQLSLSKLDKCGTVLRVAIASRLLLLALIIFWRSFFSPYDTSSTLNPKCLSSDPNDTSPSTEFVSWPRIGTAIEGSIVWDGVYFIRIAQCGYEYEQTYAFFPLLPICIYALSQTVFAPLIPIIGYRAVLALSGYVINNISFMFAAVYFYKLSVIVLKDTQAALRASIMFCFNPASIFYSSIYTESLYSLFSLGGLYHLFSGANTIAVLLLALSGFARSNGVLNAGYFCFQAMHQSYDAVFKKKHVHLAVQVLISGVVRSLCIFAPFVAFQAYGYYNICLGGSSDEVRPWCKARVPFLYDYLQGHYWGVGFLKYFQLKQLPNFLLASPILSLALFSIVNYVQLRSAIVFSLGFGASCEEKNEASVLYSSGTNRISKDAPVSGNFSPNILQEDPTLRRRKQKNKEGVPDSFYDHVSSDHETIVPSKLGYSSILIIPFILHLGFMVATAFFVMHVQVATRFLSASPPLYWLASYLMVSPQKTRRRWGYFIWAYSAAYILLGSLLFSNFYPFT